MLQIIALACALLCAVRAIRSAQLLASAAWLAGVSASVASLIYSLGAHEVAVIELSIGAGLVTVLMVFAISTVAEHTATVDSIRLHRRSLVFFVLATPLLALSAMMLISTATANGDRPLADALWQDRQADVLGQIVLLFTGVLNVLGLLALQPKVMPQPAAVAEPPARPLPDRAPEPEAKPELEEIR